MTITLGEGLQLHHSACHSSSPRGHDSPSDDLLARRSRLHRRWQPCSSSKGALLAGNTVWDPGVPATFKPYGFGARGACRAARLYPQSLSRCNRSGFPMFREDFWLDKGGPGVW